MSTILARMYEFDPATRNLAIAIVAAAVALLIGVGLWFAFRSGR
jgi:hypothetical protein